MRKFVLFCFVGLIAIAAAETVPEEKVTEVKIPLGTNQVTISCSMTEKKLFYIYVTSCFGDLKFYLSGGSPLDPYAVDPTHIPTASAPDAFKTISGGQTAYLVVVAKNVTSEFYSGNTAVVNVLCTTDKSKFYPSYGQKSVTSSINLKSETATLTYSQTGEEQYSYAIYRHEFPKSEYKKSLHCPPPYLYYSDCSSALWMTSDYKQNSDISFDSKGHRATVSIKEITKTKTTLAGIFYANRSDIPKTFLTYIALNGANTVAPFLLLTLSALFTILFL